MAIFKPWQSDNFKGTSHLGWRAVRLAWLINVFHHVAYLADRAKWLFRSKISCIPSLSWNENWIRGGAGVRIFTPQTFWCFFTTTRLLNETHRTFITASKLAALSYFGPKIFPIFPLVRYSVKILWWLSYWWWWWLWCKFPGSNILNLYLLPIFLAINTSCHWVIR